MLATYATVARRAAAITAVAAAILVGVSAALVGAKGLIGALVGVAIVAVFFGISIIVVGRAAKISPPAMMVAALATFIVKIVILMVVVSALKGTTAFSTRTLGFVAVGCIIVWSFAQVAVAIKVRLPYVDPVPGSASEPAGQAAADGKR
jgi:ATP synthase protein I